ncbi:MAG TPA: MarR family winged helix-turn-helix transcriptional regulator [Methanoregula sp.]|nr:MarR family winged helix-turn-helix transcriptional regulator [Methanoregula sp.]
MTKEIRDRTADAILTLIPLYHRIVMRHKHTTSGIQVAQIHTLGVLMRHKAMPMSEIGSRLYISRPYMTRLADVMIADGLVERQPDPVDRRVINLAITTKGKKYLKESVSGYKQDLKNSLSGLDDDDIRTLCAALEDTYRILVKLTPG